MTELHSEAELAAVLGHEIVHATVRHGANAQERGTLLQAGMAAAQIGAAVGGVDASLANLAIQGAGVSAEMIKMKYGRDQESESDLYGMKFMKRAGYDPSAAVTLQETFVRLSKAGGTTENSWMDGLFASHQPSEERVQKNQRTAAEHGPGGRLGEAEYVAATTKLGQNKPAYDKLDQAMAAGRKKDFATAKSLASATAKAVPQEGQFQEFLGEIALAEKDPQQAVTYYQKAIQLSPSYYGSYLGGGIAHMQLDNKALAEEWLANSSQMLPTAPAASCGRGIPSASTQASSLASRPLPPPGSAAYRRSNCRR